MGVLDMGMKIQDLLCLFPYSWKLVPYVNGLLEVPAAEPAVDLAAAEFAGHRLAAVVLHLLGE